METRIGNLTFTSKFDSGNLARVEKVSKDEDEEQSNSSKSIHLSLLLAFVYGSLLDCFFKNSGVVDCSMYTVIDRIIQVYIFV
jgi:hypothetical protein